MLDTMINRRAALRIGGALAVAGLGGSAAFAATAGDKKLVVFILRGAMDGLAAVVPHGEREYAGLRGRIALTPEQTLPLTAGFGLHPSLAFLHQSWKSGELGVLHAAASPYRDRSHFDGQDVLESGGQQVYALSDGWLNRAIGAMPKELKAEGVAVAPTIPLVLRGPATATSWAPSVAPPADQDTLARLMDVYADDPLLGPTLVQAIETAAVVGESGMGSGANRRGRFGAEAARQLAEAAAKLLSAPGGPTAAVLSLDGWDTHANQGGAEGQLANRLATLDASLKALKDGLGPTWKNTVVLVATEFGRTAAINGTGGTDHGTGGASFVLGGAVKGGRMLGDWPGLSRAALYQNRDLAPANDLRGLFMGALETHWGLDPRTLETSVFPGATGVRRTFA
jgi:uncharacterized protein (DUF1501 family)